MRTWQNALCIGSGVCHEASKIPALAHRSCTWRQSRASRGCATSTKAHKARKRMQCKRTAGGVQAKDRLQRTHKRSSCFLFHKTASIRAQHGRRHRNKPLQEIPWKALPAQHYMEKHTSSRSKTRCRINALRRPRSRLSSQCPTRQKDLQRRGEQTCKRCRAGACEGSVRGEGACGRRRHLIQEHAGD